VTKTTKTFLSEKLELFVKYYVISMGHPVGYEKLELNSNAFQPDEIVKHKRENILNFFHGIYLIKRGTGF
jgi:hypothetical protein